MKTKTTVLFIAIAVAIFFNTNSLFAQDNWSTKVLNNPSPSLQQTNNFGTSSTTAPVRQPINIFTGGTQKATFTAGNALGVTGHMGDGLSVLTGCGNGANLDLYTSGSCETHAKFDGSGIINGQNQRLEIIGTATNGLYFNTTDLTAASVIRFSTKNGIERMRITDVGRLGIGTINPASLLHVSTTATGEIFRTTSNTTAGNFNAWRMVTGAGAGTEKFAILNPGGSDNVIIQASRAGAIMQFNVAGTFGGPSAAPISRMVITDGDLIANTGLVGIGNSFTTPKSKLHLNDGSFSTYLQITNTNTNPVGQVVNPDANDGFKVGIAADGTAELRQQENKNMNFYTGNNHSVAHKERMCIVGDSVATPLTLGFVGIGDNFLNPQSRLHVSSGLVDSGYVQITNRNFTNEATVNDGFRLGVKGLTAQLKQQENAPMIFFTNNGIKTLERMRIDSVGRVGIGITNSHNRLEIKSDTAAGDPSRSGLRFTNLLSTSSTKPPNGKVLSVNLNGDVILVKDSSGAIANAWALLGNAGTVDGTNFIGTTDAIPFNIRVNNE